MSSNDRPSYGRAWWRFLLGMWLFVGFTPAVHAVAPTDPREVTRAPAPAWVEPVQADLSSAQPTAGTPGGDYNLLDEQQVNVAEGSHYEHVATQFLTEDAVENGARISINFDPAYEALAFHQLVVHRAGQSTDRLPRQEIKVLQRESRSDWQIYDGRLSATIILEDIRVGDVLEYAYSIHGQNPIFGGRYLDSYGTRTDEPLRHRRLRIVSPSDRPLGIKDQGETQQPRISHHGNLTEYVWDWHDLPAVISDGDVPSWFDPWPWIQFSEFDTWSAVARWATNIYHVPPSIPAELDSELRKITQDMTEEGRVLAVLYFVQDNIRYLGLETGENSHRPYPIETILSRRFGDCKDKALLLCTMLCKLGFEAYPALVNTERRQTVADWLPSPLAFNHLIVQLHLHGTEYWLDPTNRDQGGSLAELFSPAYGRALVVAPDTAGLANVRPGGFESSSEEIVDSFDFQDFEGAATFHVQTTYKGCRADGMRSFFEGTSAEEVQKEFLNYYAKWYPKITAVELPRIRDNRTQNVLIVDELYHLSKFWRPNSGEKDQLSGQFSSQMLAGLIKRPSIRVRTMPISLDYPKRVVHVVQINLPWQMQFQTEENRIDDHAFKFTFSAIPSNLRLTLRYTYEALGDHVEAQDVPEYLANVERLGDMGVYEISIPRRWVDSTIRRTPPVASVTVKATSVPAVTPTSWPSAAVLWLVLAALPAAVGIWWSYVTRRGVINSDLPPLHRCVVCGRTDRMEPSMDFRVAVDGKDYCIRHLPQRA